MVLVVVFSVESSGGYLIYTLDDPYIHLAVAENILNGGYGINTGEYAAPSSSILYPFILCVPELIGLREKGPLVINVVAMAGAVYGAGMVLRDYVNPKYMVDSKQVRAFVYNAVLALMVMLCMNAWGLVMTGMEHSLHVLLVVLVVLGFLELKHVPSRPSFSLLASVVLMPFIRFEGLALSFASMFSMYRLGYPRSSLMCLFLLGFWLCVWYVFTERLGLPFLPSSVLLKSGTAALLSQEHGFNMFFASVFNNALSALDMRQGVLVALGTLGVLVMGLAISAREGFRVDHEIAVLAVLAGSAHLFLGRYGWFSRYEVYVIVILVLSMLVLARRFIMRFPVMLFAILSLCVIAYPFYLTTVSTPAASRGIYLQQNQMRRFVLEYWMRPVGVNDLGLVSYGNSEYVLDLYGLGSEEIRSLKMHGNLSSDAIAQIAKSKGVEMFMLYDSWFPGLIPLDWQKIAVLHAPKVSSANGDVSFYYSGSESQEILKLLDDFADSLPNGAKLDTLI